MMQGFLARYGWKTMSASLAMGVLTTNHIAAGYGGGFIPPQWEDNVLYMVGLLGLVGIGHKVQKARDAAERAGERALAAVELRDPDGKGYGAGNPLAVSGAGREIVLLRETTASMAGSVEGQWVNGFAPYHSASFILTVTGCHGAPEAALDVYIDVKLPGGMIANVVHFPQVRGGGAKAFAYQAAVDAAGGAGSVVDLMQDAPPGHARPGLLFDSLRVRHAVSDTGHGRRSFTFSVSAWLQS